MSRNQLLETINSELITACLANCDELDEQGLTEQSDKQYEAAIAEAKSIRRQVERRLAALNELIGD